MTSSPPSETPTLPQLDPGVTLLEVDPGTTTALHSLVLDHVLLAEGEALWVDSRDRASTTSLAKLAPSRRTLDRIHVSRAFTAFQHYSIVEDLPAVITDDTALLVAPSVEWFYANDDLRADEGEAMLRSALEQLTTIAATNDIPVLLSRQATTGPGACVAEYSDRTLSCTRTRFGPRFVGDDVETLVYECAGATQTTLAFWRRVLAHRHADRLPEPAEVTARGTH